MHLGRRARRQILQSPVHERVIVRRAITERPDLIGAAIIDVGVLDTVRFEHSANGETNIPEFGTVNTEDGFKNIYQMSSYHHRISSGVADDGEQ